MDVKKIYKKLLAHFGPQGWWPIFDIKTQKCVYTTIGSLASYSDYRKLSSLQSFEICMGAILTQNTAWKNVEKALANLSLRAPYSGRGNPNNPEAILSCKNLEALIQPAGYYNQKAKKLRIFSEWWQKSLPTSLYKREGVRKYTSPFEKGFPPLWKRGAGGDFWGILSARQKLLSLWGIGPETADSILLYAFNKPIFVIDAYTKRLCKECSVEFKTYDEYRQFFESQLPPPAGGSAKLFNEYHALIVAWGKLYAKDKESALAILRPDLQ